MTVSILGLSGSIRQESLNRKLLDSVLAVDPPAGVRITRLSLGDYPLPVYNGDLERDHGLPDAATELKQIFAKHQGLILASPEYNGFLSPLLKNTLDWVSRRAGDEAPLASYRGKVAALFAASPGANGGLRGLFTIRQLLTNLGVMVIPDQVAVPRAANVFDADGMLTDDTVRKRIDAVSHRLFEVCGALHS